MKVSLHTALIPSLALLGVAAATYSCPYFATLEEQTYPVCCSYLSGLPKGVEVLENSIAASCKSCPYKVKVKGQRWMELEGG
jgi:hypothetical protein